MTMDLPLVRANLTKIPSTLKQGNLLSAVQSMRKGVHSLHTKNLLRNESEELVRLIKHASTYLTNSVEIKTIFPLSLEYSHGNEEPYLATLDELLDILQSDSSQEALKIAEEMSRKKESGLAKGRDELSNGLYGQACATFNDLEKEFPNDSTLINEIAQSFMDVSLNEEAAAYLKNALSFSPNNIHTLNKLAISLRKLKLFDESEKIFLRALAIDDTDPYLYFNFARLYLDWKNYEKGLSLTEKACGLLPDFQEAHKMRAYLQRQMLNS